MEEKNLSYIVKVIDLTDPLTIEGLEDRKQFYGTYSEYPLNYGVINFFGRNPGDDGIVIPDKKSLISKIQGAITFGKPNGFKEEGIYVLNIGRGDVEPYFFEKGKFEIDEPSTRQSLLRERKKTWVRVFPKEYISFKGLNYALFFDEENE